MSPYTTIWTQRMYEAYTKALPCRGAFAGYNACIDFLEYCDPNHLANLFKKYQTDTLTEKLKNKYVAKEIKTKEDFLASLAAAISSGKALQIPVYDRGELHEWLNDIFEEADEHRMGGQSGIIANLLGKLGIQTICYVPNLSKVQARRFYGSNIYFPIEDKELGVYTLRNITKSAQHDAVNKFNWIFEYEEGISFPIDYIGEFITAPRSNRLIIASRPIGLLPSFPDEMVAYLPELGTNVERALVSGYQYLTKDNVVEQMERERKNLASFTSRNPNLRVHLEFASIRDEFVRKTILDRLQGIVHSLGLNEVELITVLHDMGETKAEEAIKNKESILSIFDGLNIAYERLNIPRIHLHTLGYHILFLRSDYCPTVSLQSALNGVFYSAMVGTAKTLVGEFTSKSIRDLEMKMALNVSTSFTGIKALELLGTKLLEEKKIENLNDFIASGIVQGGKKDKVWKLIVPVQVTPRDKLKSTVGLGDSISSTAFCFDRKEP